MHHSKVAGKKSLPAAQSSRCESVRFHSESSDQTISMSDLMSDVSTHEFQSEDFLNAEDRPQEECGVFGIYAPGIDVARRTYFGIFALQHRGQESAGIAVSDGKNIDVHKAMGLVSQVFDSEDMARLEGDIAIGHTRYSTTGSSSLCNAQPILLRSSEGQTALGHNGNLVNTSELRAQFEDDGVEFETTMDTEVIAKVLESLAHLPFEEALLEMMRRVTGAYSLVFMTRDTLIAARDPNGVRPLCLGKLVDGNGWVVASETCALTVAGAEYVREVEPGEVLFINADGLESVHLKDPPENVAPRPALCVFEFIYLARPDSQLMGQNIHQARRRMGEVLARQAPVEADVVIGVPDSGTPAAIGYAAGSGIPFQEGLIKNRYIQRTFIQPDQTQRELGVRMKLTPLRDVLEGKRVVVVEDSIVRGTTTRRIVQMLRDAGAREVHLRISSPPYRWPCFYGIDTAARKDLIAYEKSVEEIRAHNGADSLAYLSMDNLIEAVGHPKQNFCRACFDGEYPIQIPLDMKMSKHVFEHHGEGGAGDPGPESEGELGEAEEPKLQSNLQPRLEFELTT
jgi:amidophosphoribosyltransferase